MTPDQERLKAIKDAHFRAGLGIGATYDGWVDAFGRADKVSGEAIAFIEHLLRKQEKLAQALQPFSEMYQDYEGARNIADTCHVSWHYDMYGTQPLTCGDLRRAKQVYVGVYSA